MQCDNAPPAHADATGVVTIEVPSALGRSVVSRLLAALEALDQKSVRLVVLRGSSDVFCRGMDLSEIGAEMQAEHRGPWVQATDDFVRAIAWIRAAQPITLAVVEGQAQGGGVGLLAACDFVIATERATFALPELMLGLAPAIILPVLGQRLGLHQTKRWAMTQATWTASDARAAGLIDQEVNVDRLEPELRRLLRSLLRCHPRGVAALKTLAREVHGMEIGCAVERGRAMLVGLLGQADVRRDLIAFRDFGMLPGEAGE
jgi:enoyl-CoA hydratase/carnithine racemase